MENDTIQELELDQNETVDIEESSNDDVDYKALYEAEKAKATKLKRKLYSREDAKEPTKTITKPDEKWKERLELKVEGYDDDAIEFIQKNGGKEALKNPYITAAIEQIKTQKAAEAAMLGEQGQKSSIEKRFSPQEFARLSHEDQLKALSELNR